MQNFTPVSALIGGTLIGLSTVLLLWLNGQIAGISGILRGVFSPQQGNSLWRVFFIFGLILGSFIYYFLPQIHFIPRTHYPISLLLLSGFLVSVGTGLSGGCTSGHGICGLARLSKRSILATSIFFVVGIVTVYFMRHIIGI